MLAVLTGTLWSLGVWRARRLGSDPAYWPTTRGEVVTSDVTVETRQTAAGSTTLYGLAIHYRYSLGWKRYESRRVKWLEPVKQRSAAPFRELLDRYPVGRRVTVHYDPRRPAEAVLEPQNRVPKQLAQAAGLASLVIGPLGLIAPYWV